MELKQAFIDLAQRYTSDEQLAQALWLEVLKAYTQPHRHYHTLRHLQHLVTQIQAVKPNIADWDAVLFALFYHDIVYKPTGKHNEEKSAALAEERLAQLQCSANSIRHCVEMILATKTHTLSVDNDINLFTDADLSILAEPPEAYALYVQQIRKEYAIYPDFLYKPGRKKVVQHFLAMPRIYKTEYFYNDLETQARINLKAELAYL